MIANTQTATGTSRMIQPINVTPRCEWRMIETRSLCLLLDLVSYTPPNGSAAALQVPIEPNSGRLADQMVLRHESPVAAVGAVVAVVADHQVLTRGDDQFRRITPIVLAKRIALLA